MADAPKQLSWDDPSLVVRSDDARTARHRLRQSWYREAVLAAPHDKVGSLLTAKAVADRPWLNFIDDAAFGHATRRAVEVQREGGALEVQRLRRNLLSSMPMCFNIFGSLGVQPAFVEVLQRLFDPRVAEVEAVTCELRPATKMFADRTAFDAAIVYRDDSGSRVLCGVETKYTEPFSTTKYSSDDYTALTDRCGWFRAGAAGALEQPASNQLWRNLMLAADAEIHHTDGVDRAWVAVVSLADDPHVAAAMSGVAAQLNDATRCKAITVENIVETASAVGLQRWATAFSRRYLGPTA